jgi:hypothetical protein
VGEQQEDSNISNETQPLLGAGRALAAASLYGWAISDACRILLLAAPLINPP